MRSCADSTLALKTNSATQASIARFACPPADPVHSLARSLALTLARSLARSLNGIPGNQTMQCSAVQCSAQAPLRRGFATTTGAADAIDFFTNSNTKFKIQQTSS